MNSTKKGESSTSVLVVLVEPFVFAAMFGHHRKQIIVVRGNAVLFTNGPTQPRSVPKQFLKFLFFRTAAIHLFVLHCKQQNLRIRPDFSSAVFRTSKSARRSL